jgi:hypothetical protein
VEVGLGAVSACAEAGRLALKVPCVVLLSASSRNAADGSSRSSASSGRTITAWVAGAVFDVMLVPFVDRLRGHVPDGCREPRGLVQGDERVAVRDLD